jgi:GLPGLI family protein
MKVLIATLFSILLSFSVYSQNENEAIGKIVYVHNTQLIGDNELNGDAILYFNQNVSKYIHLASSNESYVKEDDMSVYVVAGDAEGFPIYKDLNTNKMSYTTTIGIGKKNCIVKDMLPLLNWSLAAESKMIGRFKAQKATTKYGGRSYEAWFTAEIPISSGPYKLYGLPGLILEARSLDGRVEFLFKEIVIDDTVSQEHSLSEPVEKLVFESLAEYNIMVAKKDEELKKKMKSLGVEINVNKPHPDRSIERVQ